VARPQEELMYPNPWQQQQQQNPFQPQAYAPTVSSTLMTRVYQWMTLGLGVTGAVAMIVQGLPEARSAIFESGIIWGVLAAAVILPLVLSAFVRKMAAPVAFALFFLYAAIMGVALCPIFWLYEIPSIAATFFVTAGTFAGMTVYGYVTKKDLSGWGTFLMMGLWGLILASLVNAFVFGFQSNFLYWLTTYVGVIVFTGLTAYDTQRIKEAALAAGPEDHTAITIRGALMLYLDFINLFMYLLRLLGRARD
jgi:FtsH-binding integral membrane protein